jgi:hypothetical protein
MIIVKRKIIVDIFLKCKCPGPEDWSVGVMEYWKNENPTPIFCNFKQRPSRFSDALSSRSIDHHSSTPILLETVTGRADHL